MRRMVEKEGLGRNAYEGVWWEKGKEMFVMRRSTQMEKYI